jgi:hypothetical protein
MIEAGFLSVSGSSWWPHRAAVGGRGAGREPGARAVVDLHPGRAQLLDPAVALILVQSSSATRCTACSLRSMSSFAQQPFSGTGPAAVRTEPQVAGGTP